MRTHDDQHADDSSSHGRLVVIHGTLAERVLTLAPAAIMLLALVDAFIPEWSVFPLIPGCTSGGPDDLVVSHQVAALSALVLVAYLVTPRGPILCVRDILWLLARCALWPAALAALVLVSSRFALGAWPSRTSWESAWGAGAIAFTAGTLLAWGLRRRAS